MKSYTDINQSRKLAEILPIESADNVIVSIGDREGVKTITMPKETLNILRTPFTDIRNTTPCWSLAALLSKLPNGIVMNKDSQNGRYHFSSKYIGTYVTADNPIDACYKMIIRLNEQNLLTYERSINRRKGKSL